MSVYLAHKNSDGSVQTLSEHCRNVAMTASQFLTPVGLSQTGYLAGLIHDMGKATWAFQNRLNGDSGNVIHTFQAVRFLFERFHGKDFGTPDAVACEVIMSAVGQHHELFDVFGPFMKGGADGFQYRVGHNDMYYAEAVSGYLSDVAGENELCSLFSASVSEIERLLLRLAGDISDDDDNTMFFVGMLCRLVLSAVTDADCRDTASFAGMDDDAFSLSSGFTGWSDILGSIDRYLSGFGSGGGVSEARRTVLAVCSLKSAESPGVFRFCSPTGSGKTLSGLRFAAAHALRYDMRRLVFCAPMLSILDQNAFEIRKAVNNDSIILEHHSDVVDTQGWDRSMYGNLVRTWDAPLVLTTTVQVLNTLFDGSKAAVRRFHSFIGAIVVFDEVQNIPGRMLSLFSKAVDFLVQALGTSVVLCSATQPPLTGIIRPIRSPVRDLCPPELFADPIWRRMEISYEGSVSLDDICDMAISELCCAGSVLVVCNKKAEASDLHKLFCESGVKAYHLSAAMCQAHRKTVLSDIHKALKDKIPIVCVSTQVIEAGVDISFGSVIRILAGMDSVVQAMGRGNRHGELGNGRTGTLRLVDLRGEDLSRLRDIRDGQDACRTLLAAYEADPGGFDNRLDSLKGVEYYYDVLYRRRRSVGFCDYPCKISGKDTTVWDLLSRNFGFSSTVLDPGYWVRQGFKTAGAAFCVFEDGSISAISSWGGGREIITGLCSEDARLDERYAAALLRRARPYMVSVCGRGDFLRKSVFPLCGDFEGSSVFAVRDGWYDDVYGFVRDGSMPYMNL